MTDFSHFQHSLKPQLNKAISYIERCQRADGAIPWYPDSKLDPWDHTEAAMALSLAGREEAALRAFQWLAQHQHPEGSWWAAYYTDPQNDDAGKVETNFVAYPATGLWHHFRIYRKQDTLERFFPMVRVAIDYVIGLQCPHGDIQWATSDRQPLAKDALVTACSSVLRSLECAIHIADQLNQPQRHWRAAHAALADALRNKPWRFDRTWESKQRFSMDWFYPILAGILSPAEARVRLQERWQEFVVKDLGCRCVNDEPWVTVAESCELVLACIAAGWREQAEEIYRWLGQWQDGDGGIWTGYSFRDKAIWPQEKTTWTAAAYLLAADALWQITPAADLLTTPSKLPTGAALTPPSSAPGAGS